MAALPAGQGNNLPELRPESIGQTAHRAGRCGGLPTGPNGLSPGPGSPVPGAITDTPIDVQSW